VNTVHLAWDVMVGLATLLLLLSVWFAVCWLFRRDLPRTRWFLRAAAVSGVAAVLAMEAGWVVTEVGRQPWVVVGHLKVTDAATTNGGVWMTFLAVTAVYLTVAVSLVLILRAMSRRFREQDEEGGDEDDTDAPYGPRSPVDLVAP
jgi:cytochrome d ubiquinol oxidase subunit I